ncbi:MAG: SDR family oxidoreductase, partial [Gemmatimonadales bacterium]
MELGLKGKTALVTAGSRGFGKATARGLAAEGARIAVCARGEEDLALALAEIQEAGQEVWGGMAGHFLARALDVTDDKAVREFIRETEQDLGPIDLMLVNAGGPPAGGFFDMDLEQWQAAYQLTVETAVRLCRLVMPGMIKRRWGRIVQITSVSVLQPVENLALSSVLRPAVQALTRNLALEGAPFGVTVNSVAPGYHTTSAVERLITAKIKQTGCTREDVLADWAREIPMGRLGDPEELAALILFLMSQRAGYITGQCLVADG